VALAHCGTVLGAVDCLSRVPGDLYARGCGEGVRAI
jgi:hypothetical protein